MRCSHVIGPCHCKLSCKNDVSSQNEKFTFFSFQKERTRERERKHKSCFYFPLCSWRSHGSCRSCLSSRQKRCSTIFDTVLSYDCQKYNIVLKNENNNDINSLSMHQFEWSETCNKTHPSGCITIKKILVYFVADCAFCCLTLIFCVSILLLIVVVSTLQFWWFSLWNIQLH